MGINLFGKLVFFILWFWGVLVGFCICDQAPAPLRFKTMTDSQPK